MTLNFSSICRLCLGQKDGLLPLFGGDNSVPARIMTFAPVIKVIQVCLQMNILSYDSVIGVQIAYARRVINISAVL
jgi:hypothetical protein